MVDEPSRFWMASGGSLDCTISDVVVAIGCTEDFLEVGLLDPRDDVPAVQAIFLNKISTYFGACELPFFQMKKKRKERNTPRA